MRATRSLRLENADRRRPDRPGSQRKKKDGSILYDINFPRLMEIRTATIEALNSYYNAEEGYNWVISHLDPATKEQDQDEHFFPVYLEIYIRHNK